jgi:hypothetical protein
MKLSESKLRKLIRTILCEQDPGFRYGSAWAGGETDPQLMSDKDAAPVSVRKGSDGWSVVQHKSADSDEISSVLGSGYSSPQEAETMAQKIAHKMGANVV